MYNNNNKLIIYVFIDIIYDIILIYNILCMYVYQSYPASLDVALTLEYV